MAIQDDSEGLSYGGLRVLILGEKGVAAEGLMDADRVVGGLKDPSSSVLHVLAGD